MSTTSPDTGTDNWWLVVGWRLVVGGGWLVVGGLVGGWVGWLVGWLPGSVPTDAQPLAVCAHP